MANTASNSKLRVHFSKNSMFSRKVNMRRRAGLNCNWYKTFVQSVAFVLLTTCGLGTFAGCASDKNDLKPPDNSMREFIRQARDPGSDIETKGISSQAQEIEADLNAGIPHP
jgi:hypothetical protein